MKIKGPPIFSGPPEPPDPDSGDTKSVANQPKTKAEIQDVRNRSVSAPDAFENGLREVAELGKKQGIPNEVTVAKVVDTVLEEVLGKEFVSSAEAASIREALTPLISSDAYLMGKLNSILSRMGNKS